MGSLRRWQRVPPILFLLPVIAAVAHLVSTYVGGVELFSDPTYEQNVAAEAAGIDPETLNTPYSPGRIYTWLRGGLLVWMLCSIPVWLLELIRWRQHVPLRSVAALFIATAVIVVGNDILSNWAAAQESFIGEKASFPAYLGKIGLIFLLIASPPFALLYYARSSIMDRYLIRSVAQPLVFCFGAFIALWLIIDLSDHGPSFIDAEVPFLKVLAFYGIQLPTVVVQILPITILLSLLYALGRMSRTNEIISMFGAGKSVSQVLRPCVLGGIYLSLVCMALNYFWAPTAEGRKQSMYKAIKEGYVDEKKKVVPTLVDKQFYRNREANRSWYIGEIPFDLKEHKIRNVWIVEDDANGKPTRTIVAKSARWWPPAGPWRFYQAKIVEYDEGLPLPPTMYLVKNEEGDGDKVDLHDLPETPWRIFSTSFDPEFLGIPQLTSYINTNSTLPPEQLAPFKTFRHYRFSYAWQCLIVVLIAAPLGLVFSRRGLIGGVVASVMLFFAMFFIDNLFLAKGQGNQINPIIGSWLPIVIFGFLGLCLLWARANNKELPKIRNMTAK